MTFRHSIVSPNHCILRLKPAHILIPVAGAVALGLLMTKKASGALNYFVSKVAVSFDGFTPVLRLDIAIQNPTNSQFVVKSIAGDVLANDSVIGNASMFQTLVVPPNAQTIMPVYVRLSPLAIVSDLVSIITKGSGIPQTIKFKGYVNANDFVTDLSLSYNIT
jgi:late embryogenesis abundant protein